MDHGFSVVCENFECRTNIPIAAEELTITARVGAGGSPNRKPDVEKIQRALNRVDPLYGGPQLPLKIDGICGPLTRAAIVHFQTKWNIMPRNSEFPDGMIDPDGGTIKRLRQGPGRSDSLPLEFAGRIPRVLEILAATRAAIQMARDHYAGRPSFTGIAAAKAAKVEKHFHLSKTTDPMRRVIAIEQIYLEMQRAIGHIPQGSVIALDEPPEIATGAYMFAFRGGFSVEERSTEWRGIRRGSIYVCPRARLLSPDGFVHVMIHELAHFVGPVTNGIGDLARFHRERTKYQNLTPDQAANNADSYSQLAFEFIGKPDFNVLKDSGEAPL